MDERAHAGDDQQHDGGESIHREVAADAEITIQSKSCSESGVSPSASTVLSAQANESATEPMAMALIAAFEKRRPKIPLTRKPASGSTGMSQSCCIKQSFQRWNRALSLHGHLFNSASPQKWTGRNAFPTFSISSS
jgi:hypothetical protein